VTSDFSDFVERNGSDNLLGEAGELTHGDVEMSLHTSDPGDAGTGAEIVDPGYSRQNMSFTILGQHTDGTYQLTNNSDVTFGPFDDPHLGISHTALYTPSGDMLMRGPLGTVFDVQTGDSYTFDAGNLTYACG
jgi:hypothetical protein